MKLKKNYSTPFLLVLSANLLFQRMGLGCLKGHFKMTLPHFKQNKKGLTSPFYFPSTYNGFRTNKLD